MYFIRHSSFVIRHFKKALQGRIPSGPLKCLRGIAKAFRACDIKLHTDARGLEERIRRETDRGRQLQPFPFRKKPFLCGRKPGIAPAIQRLAYLMPFLKGRQPLVLQNGSNFFLLEDRDGPAFPDGRKVLHQIQHLELCLGGALGGGGNTPARCSSH